MVKLSQVLGSCYTIIAIFCIAILGLSWSISNKYNNMLEFKEKIPLNWDKNFITSIQIIKSDENCSQQYESIVLANLFDEKSYNISNQQKSEEKHLFTTQTAKTKENIVNNILSSFAFIDQSNSDKQWKICAKYMNDISFSSKKNQTLEMCSSDERICNSENNQLFCVKNEISCPTELKNYCAVGKKQCISDNKLECIDQEDDCSEEKENKECLNSQKHCIIQDRVLCLEVNEQCPIVDILIIEKSSQIPKGYEEEHISFDSNYKLVVQRNDPSKWPVVEITIQREQNACLIEKHLKPNLFTIMNNSSSVLNKCMDGIDNRFEELFQNSLSTKQLLLANNIIQTDEEINPDLNQQFKIYKRKYFFYDTKCGSTNDFDGFNVKFKTNFYSARAIIQTVMVTLIIINIIVHFYLSVAEKNSKRYKKCLVYINFFNFVIFILTIEEIISMAIYNNKSLKVKISQTEDLINDSCSDTYINSNIVDVFDQLNTLQYFWKSAIILSAVNLVLILINSKLQLQMCNSNQIDALEKCCDCFSDLLDCMEMCSDCFCSKDEKSNDSSNWGCDGCDCDCDCGSDSDD